MCTTITIESKALHGLYSVAYYFSRNCNSNTPIILMCGCSHNFDMFAIEEKSFISIKNNLSDTETGFVSFDR